MRDRRVLASVLAVVATAGAALLRALLSRWLGYELPFITFFGAVMAAAWYGGLFPACWPPSSARSPPCTGS